MFPFVMHVRTVVSRTFLTLFPTMLDFVTGMDRLAGSASNSREFALLIVFCVLIVFADVI